MSLIFILIAQNFYYNCILYIINAIFCIFGAPVILKSDNGREFVNKIINDLKTMWPTLKIVHSKPRHSQSHF